MKLADFTEEQPRARASGRDVSEYVVDGARVPSVTEVLELAKLSDIDRIIRVAGADVVANAARRGQAVHLGCQIVDDDPDFDVKTLPLPIQGYVQAYQRFVRETCFEPQLIEERLVSPSLRFAGTVDRVGICQVLVDELMTIDLKTPAAADPSWPIQTAGYALLVEDAYGMRTARASLQLRPNGRYKLERHADTRDYRTFRAALDVAHFRLAHGLATLED